MDGKDGKMSNWRQLMDKRYHEIINKMATDEEVKRVMIYGQPALDYTKKELIKFLIWLEGYRR